MSKQITNKAFRKQSGAAVVVNILWKTDPYARLGKLKNAVRKKYLIKASRAASKIILKKMREYVPVKTGTLKKSLSYRAYVPKKSAEKHVGVGVIGARRRFIMNKSGALVQFKKKDKVVDTLHRPSKYFHLVNKGTKRADARPFAEMALRSEWPQAKQAMFDALSLEVRNVWP